MKVEAIVGIGIDHHQVVPPEAEQVGGFAEGVVAALGNQHGNAVAAQMLVDQGASRIAILDVDYHHGNGTQRIFYERDDVLYASIHATPECEYPFPLGYAREKGRGRGEGFNLNLPLPLGTTISTYRPALAEAIDRVRAHTPDLLIVSLGVDSYIRDPVGGFALESDDYLLIGADIARAYLQRESKIPIIVHRNYALPAFVNSETLVISSDEQIPGGTTLAGIRNIQCGTVSDDSCKEGFKSGIIYLNRSVVHPFPESVVSNTRTWIR